MGSTVRSVRQGELVTSFRKSKALIAGWLLLFGFPAFLIINYWWNNRDESVIPLFAGLALLAPAVFVALDRWRYRVDLYEKALTLHTLLGSKTARLHEGTKIYQKIVQEKVYGVNASRHINMTIDDGKRTVKLSSSLVDSDALLEMLLEFQMETIGPAVFQRYQQGRTADFGAIQMRNGNIFYKKKPLPLSDVRAFEIEQGFFRLYKQGKRSRFFGTATETIANLHVFLALLQQTSPVGEMEEV